MQSLFVLYFRDGGVEEALVLRNQVRSLSVRLSCYMRPEGPWQQIRCYIPKQRAALFSRQSAGDTPLPGGLFRQWALVRREGGGAKGLLIAPSNAYQLSRRLLNAL